MIPGRTPHASLLPGSFPLIPAGLWFVLTVSMVFSGAVDLWVQTLIHLVLTFLILYAVSRGAGQGLTLPDRSSLALWGGVLLALGTSTLYSGAPTKSQQEFWNWINYFLVFLLMSGLDAGARKSLRHGLFASWSLLLIWGSWQALGRPENPPRAGLLNANALGSYLLIPLWLGMEACLEPPARKNRWPWVFTSLAFLLFLVTRSTGALCAFGISALFFVLSYKKKPLSTAPWILGAAGLCLLPFLWKIFSSQDPHRLLWWKAALAMGSAHPWIGLGPATFELALPQGPDLNLFTFYAHNTWLQWWAELGVWGVGGIFWLVSGCLRRQSNAYHASASIGLLTHNLLDYSLILPSHALLFWSLQAPSPTRTPEAVPSRWAPASRIAVHLLLVSLAIVSVQRFQTNRDYAKAVYYQGNNQPREAHMHAQRAIKRNDAPADPHALLARLRFEEAQKMRSRGAMDQALVDMLQALRREPLHVAYWISAGRLYALLGFPHKQDELKHDLVKLYPFFAKDRRLESPS